METPIVPSPTDSSVPRPSFEAFVPKSDQQNISSGEYKDEGWSWGGFALNWIFLLAVRKYTYLFFLILMFIPIVNFIVFIGMMIFMGLQGREIARVSRTFANHEQYLGFMKGVDHAGKIVAYFYLLILFVTLAFFVLMFSAFSGHI